MAYSLSHAAAVRWALEMEYYNQKVTEKRTQDDEIIQFLLRRIKEIKQLENELALVNSKGVR
jgi:hypothetical protein